MLQKLSAALGAVARILRACAGVLPALVAWLCAVPGRKRIVGGLLLGLGKFLDYTGHAHWAQAFEGVVQVLNVLQPGLEAMEYVGLVLSLWGWGNAGTRALAAKVKER